MKRALANVISGVLLLLCVAMCVLWARSYVVYDSPRVIDEGPSRTTGTRDWGVWTLSCRGSLRVTAYLDRYDPELSGSPGRIGRRRWNWVTHPLRPADWRAFDVRARRNHYPHAKNVNGTLVLPHAVWAVVLGVLPVRRLLRWRRTRRRARLGLCLACGYDLRESSGRCPECGMQPAEA